jgi:Uncharacterized conserved protein (DUF2304).
MSIQFRIMLVILTASCFIYLIKNVKKGKIRGDYAMGWILCSMALLIVSIFPQIAYIIASLLGIISPANIVFAIITFLLIIMVYVLFAKVSTLEERQKNLVHELALLRDEICKDNEYNT